MVRVCATAIGAVSVDAIALRLPVITSAEEILVIIGSLCVFVPDDPKLTLVAKSLVSVKGDAVDFDGELPCPNAFAVREEEPLEPAVCPEEAMLALDETAGDPKLTPAAEGPLEVGADDGVALQDDD